MNMTDKGAGLAVGLSHVDRLTGAHCEGLVELATEVEEAGADQIVLSEHVALANVIADHPGAAGGGSSFPFGGDEVYPEPFVTLGAMAAVTRRVRLSTNVVIAPLRPAPLLAKLGATLDCVSGGRLDLGVGSGWHRPEFDAVGVPLEESVIRMEDNIRACQALWRDAPASFASRTVTFENMFCSPRPVQPEIPIWFGGGPNRGVARRVVEMGRGWSPLGGTSLKEIEEGIGVIADECKRIGRDRSSIGVRVMVSVDGNADGKVQLAELAEKMDDAARAGVTVVQIPLGAVARSRGDVRPVVERLRESIRHSRAGWS